MTRGFFPSPRCGSLSRLRRSQFAERKKPSGTQGKSPYKCYRNRDKLSSDYTSGFETPFNSNRLEIFKRTCLTMLENIPTSLLYVMARFVKYNITQRAPLTMNWHVFSLSVNTRSVHRFIFYFFSKSFKLLEEGNLVTGTRVSLCSAGCRRHHIYNLQMIRKK